MWPEAHRSLYCSLYCSPSSNGSVSLIQCYWQIFKELIFLVLQLQSHVWHLQPHEFHHIRLPCPSLFPGICSDSCPLRGWSYLTIILCCSLLLRSSPSAGSFPVIWFFASGSQSNGASYSESALPMNIRGWFLFGLTGLISLLSKRLAKVFSSNTIQKHQFFGAQPSLQFNSHTDTWLWEKP